MRPPPGFEAEKYPLRHRLINSFGLSLGDNNKNTAFIPLIHSSLDVDVAPSAVIVNPHNTSYMEDPGPLVRQQSIIDRLKISIKFSMTNLCAPTNETASATWTGDDVPALKFLWRPIFNVFPEKLDAADDDTGTTVAAILAMTKDATFEDVVPITTANLPSGSPNTLALAASTVNAVQSFGDFNMTSDLEVEDHVFNEDTLQNALRRYTNKGALRSCLGRTRHVTLTRQRPYQNVYIDKPVPRAVRRILPYGMFGIQVHVPLDTDEEQLFLSNAASAEAHLGCKIITTYDEWNVEHNQDTTA